MTLLPVAIGALICLTCLLIAWRARRNSADRIFVGVTPGLFPAAGQPERVERVRGGREYAGPVAVQFQPPRGLAPGLVGTIVDGHAELRDVTATIIDLAVRGFLRIESIQPGSGRQTAARSGPGLATAAKGTNGPRRDWVLIACPDPPVDPRPFEIDLLRGLFRAGPRVRMSDLQASAGQAMRQAQVELYRQSVAYGWYPRHPATAGGALRIWGVLILMLGLIGTAILSIVAATGDLPWWGISGPIAVIIGGLTLLLVGRRIRVGRTAAGTAMAVQARGFKQYLATAEAGQIRFEEASEIFSRYLPYAIVFGVAEHWAKVFGEVGRRYKESVGDGFGNGAGDALFDLMWFDMVTGVDLLGPGILDADLFNLPDVFAGLDGVDGAGIGDIGEVFSGFADGVGDFVNSANGFDLPGLDGCDLDLGGCDGCS